MSRQVKQFCRNNHNTFSTGRYKGGGCIACEHEWKTNHKTQRNEQQIIWRRENIDHVNSYEVERRKSNLQAKLAWILRSRLCMAVKNNWKVGSAVKDLGCSIDFLKQYIESKFLLGMTWDNHGRGIGMWHIDHIIPLDAFDLSDRNQLVRAVHYTNLQPLWQNDNLSKGSKILVSEI